MKTILLAAGAAALVLSAGPTLAAAKHAATMAGPKQPIPYGQLDAYLKASPKQRMAKDWWSGQAGADTGAAASASATAATPSPSLPGDTPSAASAAPAAGPALPANPPVDNPPSTAVNPPATAAPGAPTETTPPK